MNDVQVFVEDIRSQIFLLKGFIPEDSQNLLGLNVNMNSGELYCLLMYIKNQYSINIDNYLVNMVGFSIDSLAKKFRDVSK
ncbi:hypothetical protein D1841_16905 [Neglecta sp. X4]|uniref:hypothetical protein n=1 Tax=unclassified Neglectibacter TaxID=2632164 RepID=UPI0013707EFD|nr:MULTISPECIES: hypothetical protein [unclassified Neglectibacter]NBI19153.1 hypothetical protein [Neglectibacter sp. 59]NBJ74829.1 hypothetical protein [Neglectibacter sp. X4]NCE82653.1 hypothetical protein [Neglectibacter sp. X58]